MDEKVWRQAFKVSSLAVASVSGALFFMSMVFVPNFLFLLCTWFLLLTGLFHYAYFVSPNVRQIHIRLIDFPYIGFGVIGFFLLIYGQHERDTYWEQVSQTVGDAYYRLNTLLIAPSLPTTAKHSVPPSVRAPETREDLKLYVADLRAYHCNEVDEDLRVLGTQFCSLMRDISDSMGLSKSEEVWAPLLEGFYKVAYDNEIIGPKAPGGISFIPNSLNQPTFLGPLPALSPEYHRRYWYKYRLNRITVSVLKSLDHLTPKRVNGGSVSAGNEWARTENTSDESFGEFIWSVFKLVLWPFILAISLGLRLTKVTADVTGWAR